MREGIVFAGFGGQGIILSGLILCHAAMEEGKQVSHIPSYGAEMRGGTANCSVVVSDSPHRLAPGAPARGLRGHEQALPGEVRAPARPPTGSCCGTPR